MTLLFNCRVAEFEYVSQRANEERKRRPHYRPIIEHDGLPRQLSSTQVPATLFLLFYVNQQKHIIQLQISQFVKSWEQTCCL